MPFRYFFIDGPPGQAEIPNLAVPKASWALTEHVPFLWSSSPKYKDVCLLIRYFYCANYTLDHTQARWVARLADDTLVNFAKLRDYFEHLEARYDPVREFVFKAHCIDWANHILPYPQGGAGAVLSRFACSVSIQHQIPILKGLKPSFLEDVEIGRYLLSHNFPMVALAGDNFVGHVVLENMWNALLNPDTLQQCSTVKVESGSWARGDQPNGRSMSKCGHFFTVLNEVVFLHVCIWRSPQELLDYSAKFFDAPPWVLWWNPQTGFPRFCREENASRRSELSFWKSKKVTSGPFSY
jgi:hypothetical protein